MLDFLSSVTQARKAPGASTAAAASAGNSETGSSATQSSSDLLKNLLMPQRGASPSASSVVELLKVKRDSPATGPSSASGSAVEAVDGPQVLVQFKKTAPSIPLLAAAGSLLVYGASERRLRMVDWMRGWKCSLDRSQGSYVDVAFSEGQNSEDATLAILCEDGEVILGRVVSNEDAGELLFDAQAILSFPEIGRAAGLRWSKLSSSTGASSGTSALINGKKHLAVFGQSSSEVFFVHVHGLGPVISTKTSFISTRIKQIQEIACIGGLCFVAGDAGVEVFKWNGASSCFEATEFVQFGDDVAGRSLIFECPALGIVIGRIEGGSVIKFFSYREGDAQEISQLTLPDGVIVDNVVFDAVNRVLLCYSRGASEVHAIRIRKLQSPQLVPAAFIADAGVLKLVLADENVDEEVEGGVCFFAYLNDCIVQHTIVLEETSSAMVVETETEAETDEKVTTEAEIETEIEETQTESESETEPELELETDDFISESMDVSSPKVSISTLESSTSPAAVYINPEEIKAIVREAVKECVQESLSGIIHEALNASVQAGFGQIAHDLRVLIEELVRNVASTTAAAANGSSQTLSVPAQLPPSPSIQDIRALISEGKSGEALIKAASANDSRLLLEACRQLDDPFTALDKEPLSQGTLVTLFKMLSMDIDEDTELKLDWLQEVLIQIDMEEAVGECPTLWKDIGVLLADLKELVGDSFVDGNNLQKKMKTVMRLLRKFQMN